MTSMGERLLAISKHLRANKDLDKIGTDAQATREPAATITKQFPPGSTQFSTAAKPVVWKEWATFESNAKKLEVESEKLMKANVSDGEALRSQFRAVAFACDGCHETYRIPKEK
jgi:cytochrome c556